MSASGAPDLTVPVYPVAGTTWGPEERDALYRLIAAGRFTMGEAVRAFEAAFAARLGVAHAVMVNSGSSANLAGIAALAHRRDRPLRRGDEVIVPALAWSTTFSPLQQYGLKLRFVDIDLHTLNIDVARIESALTPRTRMVMAVNILGNPSPLDDIRALCDRRGLILFEDNCESLGARLHGRPCGTFGDVATFSTFYSHQLSTMEGGMLVTRDRDVGDLAHAVRDHGWGRDVRSDAADPEFPEAYRFTVPGYNLRPLELSGAAGLVQLEKLDAAVAVRRRNAGQFHALFAADSRFILQREHGESSWFSFTMIIRPESGLRRAQVLAALRGAGIEFRMITGGCFLRHEAIRFFDHDVPEPIVNANIAHDHGFFVGNHPRDLSVELRHLHAVLNSL